MKIIKIIALTKKSGDQNESLPLIQQIHICRNAKLKVEWRSLLNPMDILVQRNLNKRVRCEAFREV